MGLKLRRGHSVLLTAATEYWPWLRTLTRQPQSKAISKEMASGARYLQRDEKDNAIAWRTLHTLNSSSMMKLAAVRGKRLQSHPYGSN